MDRKSREYRRLEKVATVLVYTFVTAAVVVALTIVYVVIALAVNLT